ncbi:MAG: tripartite tricarboxylate transporter substrate binding protein, partial [Comamonadaceae bacterium]
VAVGGGAGGSIGASNVAGSAADGYTLLMGTVGTAAINPSLYKNLSYDSTRDFTPIATVAAGPVAIVASPKSGLKSLADILAAAKARPGALTYGSAGNGTPGHLAGAMFCAATGIKLQHVPYKGSAPAVTDLLGGQIDLMFDPLQSVLPHVQAGKLQALGVTSRERASVLRAVPTVAEATVPGFEMTAWWAVYGPANLPAPVTSRLLGAIEKVVKSPAFEGQLVPQGVQPLSTPLAKLQADEIAKWGAAVRTAGITLE